MLVMGHAVCFAQGQSGQTLGIHGLLGVWGQAAIGGLFFNEPGESLGNGLLIWTFGFMRLPGCQKRQQGHGGCGLVGADYAGPGARAVLALMPEIQAPFAVSCLVAIEPVKGRAHGSFGCLCRALAEKCLAMSFTAETETFSLSADAGLVAQSGTYAHAAFSGRTGQVLYAESV